VAKVSSLVKIFGDTPQVRLLEVLIRYKDTTMHLSMLARRARVSVSSVERCLSSLVKQGIVSDIRFFRQRRIFHLNPQNPIAKLLVKFRENITKQSSEK
jgi:Fe2+ or Zn2+ uptake regulation protein